MQKNTFFQASLIGLGAVLAACSSSSTPAGPTGTGTGDSGSGAGTPTVAITSPANNGTLTLAADKTGDIAFTVTNFTLKAPGSCGSATNCGHIHLLIDGTACNDTAGGVPYNIAPIASPAAANFALCPTADGPHTIVLELHNDDHSPFQVNGQTVSATVTITTSG